MPTPGRNEPCPCGSGRKFKKCCFGKDSTYIERKRQADAKMAAKPPKPENARRFDLPKEEAITLCVEQLKSILTTDRVGMVTKLVDRAVVDLSMDAPFCYGDIAETLQEDDRFTLVKGLCALAGDDPVKLYVDKLGI